MNKSKLIEDLVRDENLRLKPYRDTEGKLTIGVGHNLDDNGIKESVAMVILDDDIKDVKADLDRNIPWWRSLPEPVARGLANMAFNLGWPRLSGFKKMLAALEEGDYVHASVEALDSKWAREDVSPDRSGRIAELIMEGNS